MSGQNTEIKKYKVQKEDTLESIARKLGITVEGLRSFHNQHCELEDLLGSKLYKGLQEIYIQAFQASSGDIKIKEEKSTISEPIQGIHLKRSYVKINKTYGVVQKIYENEELLTQIHYIVKVGNDVASDLPYNQLYVRKYKTYVNEKEIELNLEQLSEKLEQLLYPLKLNLDEKGVPYSIANKKEIKEQWFEEGRPEFVRYYTGELAEKILSKLDNFFSHISHYETHITHSLFYTFFFMPLYVKYEKNREYKYEKEIPIYPFKPQVKYKITQRLEEKLSSSGKIFVYMEGICTEERSGREITRGDAMSNNKPAEIIPPKGELTFTYKLEKNTQILFSARGQVTLEITPEITRKIRMEIYEQ